MRVSVLGDTVNKDKSSKQWNIFVTLNNSLRVNAIVECFIIYLALLNTPPSDCNLLPVHRT